VRLTRVVRAVLRNLGIGPLLLALLSVTPADAARRSRCVVTRGSRLVARDRQAVVISDLVTRPDGVRVFRLRSCARDKGKFRVLLTSLPDYDGTPQAPKGPYRLKLVGAYVAYGTYWGYHGEAPHGSVSLGNVETGMTVRSPDELGPAEPAQLVLSSTGVVAWLWTVDSDTQYSAEVRALSAHTKQTATLDSSSASTIFSTGPLTDLQLYQCASGCTTPSTVIAWRHSGTWQYARVN
jgi:hypothetical protein